MVFGRMLHTLFSGADIFSSRCSIRCSCVLTAALCVQNGASLQVILHQTSMKQILCPSLLFFSPRVDVLDLVFQVSKIWISLWWSRVYLWAASICWMIHCTWQSSGYSLYNFLIIKSMIEDKQGEKRRILFVSFWDFLLSILMTLLQ